MKKTTIYIDIDDDIAGIAEKIQNASEKIVALVLPKRPSVLQGSVNMNLLRRTSEDSSKSIVLITTDEQVLRLAGQIGIHVSSSLQSKPYVPTVEDANALGVEEVSDSGTDDSDMAQPDVFVDDKKVDLKTPIGVLAGVPDDDDEIDLDNNDPAEEEVGGTDPKAEKPAKSKKIAVPNFNSFRAKMGLGIIVLLSLVAGIYWAFVIAPKASITLSTQKTDSNAKIIITASKDQPTVDAEKGLLPATRKEDKQKLTGTFKATGSKDVGTKATGTVTLSNCGDSKSISIASGTGVSRGSLTFITQTSVTLPPAGLSGGSPVCSSGVDVKVVANQPGDNYNVSTGNFTVASDYVVSASGGPMGGGSTKLVKVVTAEDVETAKAKVLETAADNVKGKITTLLSNDNLVPVADTFVSDVGTPVPSIAVDAEAPGDVTLTLEITSSMLGFKRSDIDPLLTKEILKKINASTQKIYTTGSDQAVIAVLERPGADSVKISVAVSAKVGPNIDQAQLKKDIAGKKAGDAKQSLESRPGVSKADIKLSPFWVFSIPKKTQKITVQINE